MNSMQRLWNLYKDEDDEKILFLKMKLFIRDLAILYISKLDQVIVNNIAQKEFYLHQLS
jgi:hypothetical protein